MRLFPSYVQLCYNSEYKNRYKNGYNDQPEPTELRYAVRSHCTNHTSRRRGASMEATLSFGQWLKQNRKSLDLTQEDLAERIGCSYISIHKIEADERRP